jgi:prevent-host-death family protein
MREADPTTQTMNVTDAREHWSQVISAVFRRQKRVVLEKAGVPVAAIVSTEDLERLRRYDAERAADFAVIDRMRAAFKDVPDEELEREITNAVAEARADLRAEREQVSPNA